MIRSFAPDWKSRRPLPLTHFELPAVTSFQGASEYSMVLMARTDAPLFHDVAIRCFYPLLFSISQPAPQFSRTTKFKTSYHPRVCCPLQSPRQGHTFLHQHRHCPMERSLQGAGLCVVLSPLLLDASFTSARLNIRDYIGNAAKLVL
jgi:hypothetical protein